MTEIEMLTTRPGGQVVPVKGTAEKPWVALFKCARCRHEIMAVDKGDVPFFWSLVYDHVENEDNAERIYGHGGMSYRMDRGAQLLAGRM